MTNTIADFWANHSEMILGIGYKGVLAVVVLAASYFVVKALHRSIERANQQKERLDPTLVPILRTTASVAIYAVCLVIVLDIFGVNTTSIIALLGAAGIAVAFALKDTLSNIAAGIMLLILRPFRKDHFIECGSVTGTVKEIRLFTTILETIDGLYISAPNSTLWAEPVKNYTMNGKRRMDQVIGISYSDSIDRAFEVFREIINNEPRFLSDPEPQMMVRSLGDSSVNLTLRAWLINDDYWTAYWELNKRIKENIEAAGLTIPFPQRDVHMYDHTG
ncbi:MAG: mechanosensitive ion channel family protein [Desulfarculaceae bacterium]|nr:mechanosensitive ion channel family protein [Desulfarculaceae bacterium]